MMCNRSVGEAVQPCGPENTCEPDPTPLQPDAMCQAGCEYYRLRAEDFKSRHVGCGHTVPDYYMNYGYKYCERFTNETAQNLSPQGKRWLKRVRCELQIFIEEELKKDPKLELRDDGRRLRGLAFDSHPKIYTEAGLGCLPVGDVPDIVGTPDGAEWKNSETWSQAASTGGMIVSETVLNAVDIGKMFFQKDPRYCMDAYPHLYRD